jgi:STE24 endopeptidase
MTISIVSFPIGLLLGAGGTKYVHDREAVLGWMAVVFVTAFLYPLAKRMFGAPSGLRLVLLATAYGLATGGWMLLVVEVYPARPNEQLAAVGAVLGLICCLVGAVLTPLLVVMLPLRLNYQTASLSSALVLLRMAMWVLVLLVNLGLLGVALVLVPPGVWRVAIVLAIVLALPLLSTAAWGSCYSRILARWHLPDMSKALRTALDELHARADFRFQHVLCLQKDFGGGLVCEVVDGFRGSTLVISSAIPDRLDKPELVALLAHEAAHVCLNHSRRKLVSGSVAVLVCVAAGTAIGVPLAAVIPGSFGFVPGLVTALILVNGRGLYTALVTRRHEFEADDFAAQVAGAESLLGALESLNFTESRTVTVHNRWTTHGTWEVRSARLRQMRTSNRE